MASTTDKPTTAKSMRERARAELIGEIKAAARRQLAAAGAPGLSLRAIARELEMASSAIYRYFPSRDDLLTALIVDAYDAVGEIAEQADDLHATEGPAARWLAVCRAVRAWALANPHEYALVYGSPIPDYRAPVDTVAHAARVAQVLARYPIEAAARRATSSGAAASTTAADDIDRAFHADELRELMVDVPPEVTTRGLVAWTELFGLISFELFGHLVGSVTDYDAFFDRAIRLTGEFAGFDA